MAHRTCTNALFDPNYRLIPISSLFFREKITKNILYASFFMFVGLYIIFNDSLELGSLVGNMYALFCTMLFSISFVLLSKYKEMLENTIERLNGMK